MLLTIETLAKIIISSELKKACPEGIDLYFDNVGGKQLEGAIDNMKTFGRIVLCGMISQYTVCNGENFGKMLVKIGTEAAVAI